MDFSVILGPSTTEEKKPEPSDKSAVKTGQHEQLSQSRNDSYSSRSAASSPAQPSSRRQTVSSLLNDDDFDYSSRREKKNSISSILDKTPSSTSVSSNNPIERHPYSLAAGFSSASPTASTAYSDQTSHRDQSLNSVISLPARQQSVTSNQSATNSPTMSNILATDSQRSPSSRVSILTPEGVSANNVLSILNHETSSSPPPVRTEFKKTSYKQATPSSIANIITSTTSAVSPIKPDNESLKTNNSSPLSSSIPSQFRESYASQNKLDGRLSMSNIDNSISQTYHTPNILKQDTLRRSSISSNSASLPVFKNPVYQSKNNGSNLQTPSSLVSAQKIQTTTDTQNQNESKSKSETFQSTQPKLQPSLLQKPSTESSHTPPKLQPNLLNELENSASQSNSVQNKTSQFESTRQSESLKLETKPTPVTTGKQQAYAPPESSSEENSEQSMQDYVLELENSLEKVPTNNSVLPLKAQSKAIQRKDEVEISNSLLPEIKTEVCKDGLKVGEPASDQQLPIAATQKLDVEKTDTEVKESKTINFDIKSKEIKNYDVQPEVTDGQPIRGIYDIYNNPIPIWAQNFRTVNKQKPVVTVQSNGQGYGGRRSGHVSSVANLPFSLNGVTPFNDLTRKIATWLYVRLFNLEKEMKHVEVEIKLGKICYKNTRERINLNIITDTVLDFQYAKTRTVFEPGLTDEEFIKAKYIFDNLAEKSKRNPSSPTAIINFPERETTDIIMPEIKSSNNLRITYNEENKETERIIKKKIDQLLVHSPRSNHDFRITVSVELPEKESVIDRKKFTSETKRVKRQKSYIHKALQVDLTQVKIDDVKKMSELELEINQSLLLQYYKGTKDNVESESINYESLIQFTIDSARLIVEQLAS